MVSSSFSWEKVYTLDFGIDFGLFNNRLNGTFDWYRRDTKDMLAPGMDLPWVVGASAAKQKCSQSENLWLGAGTQLARQNQRLELPYRIQSLRFAKRNYQI